MTSMPIDFDSFKTSCDLNGYEAIHQTKSLFYVRTKNKVKTEIKFSKKKAFYVAGHGLDKTKLEFLKTELQNSNMIILEQMVKFLKVQISDDVLAGFWKLVNTIENIDELIQRQRASRFYQAEYSDNVFMYVASDIANMLKYCPPGSPWSRGKIFDDIDKMITVGYSIKGREQEKNGKPAYREHTVPIDWTINKAFEMFQNDYSVDEVAQMFKRNIKIVLISDEEQDLLDNKLKLRTTMPLGFEDGHDPLTRIHFAGIVLENTA